MAQIGEISETLRGLEEHMGTDFSNLSRREKMQIDESFRRLEEEIKSLKSGVEAVFNGHGTYDKGIYRLHRIPE